MGNKTEKAIKSKKYESPEDPSNSLNNIFLLVIQKINFDFLYIIGKGGFGKVS